MSTELSPCAGKITFYKMVSPHKIALSFELPHSASTEAKMAARSEKDTNAEIIQEKDFILHF